MICPYCKAEFQPKWRNQKYCSTACGHESQKNPNRMGTCEHCGKPFERKQYRKTRDALRFCSRECAFEAKRRAVGPACVIHFTHCIECGILFTSQTTRLFCSEDCRKRRASAKMFAFNANKKLLIERNCKECGRKFIAEYGEKRRTFCSDWCMRKHSRRVAKGKRRARTQGSECQSIDPIKIFERDKWICQLCKIRTLKGKRGTCHDRAPELDHIIPLSKGGDHTAGNVQCSCRACNGRKSAQTQGQMRCF
jgi:5-methylcytosine-specific restriction endonuclease McrA